MELKQYTKGLVERMKEMLCDTSLTENEAVGASMRCPGKVYYTSDTHLIVVGGKVYGKGTGLHSVFQYVTDPDQTGISPFDRHDVIYFTHTAEAGKFAAYFYNEAAGDWQSAGFQDEKMRVYPHVYAAANTTNDKIKWFAECHPMDNTGAVAFGAKFDVQAFDESNRNILKHYTVTYEWDQSRLNGAGPTLNRWDITATGNKTNGNLLGNSQYATLTPTGLSAGKGGIVGFNRANDTSTWGEAHAAVVIVRLIDCWNCNVELYDEIVTHTSIASHFNANGSGWWYAAGAQSTRTNGNTHTGDVNTNSDAYNIRRRSGNMVMKNALYRYMLCFKHSGNELLAATTVNNNTGTSKALTTESFDILGDIFYYNYTTNVAAGGTPSIVNLWQQIDLDLRYSFNTGTTLTPHKEVYLAVRHVPGTVSMCTIANIAQPIVQELDEDLGKIDYCMFIYLGRAYSNYQISLDFRHPVYKWDSTLNAFIPWTPYEFGDGFIGSAGTIIPALGRGLGWTDMIDGTLAFGVDVTDGGESGNGDPPSGLEFVDNQMKVKPGTGIEVNEKGVCVSKKVTGGTDKIIVHRAIPMGARKGTRYLFRDGVIKVRYSDNIANFRKYTRTVNIWQDGWWWINGSLGGTKMTSRYSHFEEQGGINQESGLPIEGDPPSNQIGVFVKRASSWPVLVTVTADAGKNNRSIFDRISIKELKSRDQERSEYGMTELISFPEAAHTSPASPYFRFDGNELVCVARLPAKLTKQDMVIITDCVNKGRGNSKSIEKDYKLYRWVNSARLNSKSHKFKAFNDAYGYAIQNGIHLGKWRKYGYRVEGTTIDLPDFKRCKLYRIIRGQKSVYGREYVIKNYFTDVYREAKNETYWISRV